MSEPSPRVAAARAAEKRCLVPTPERFITARGYQVNVAELLARGERDQVAWYEIAAMAEALLRAAAVGEPSEEAWEAAAEAYKAAYDYTMTHGVETATHRYTGPKVASKAALQAALPILAAAQAQEVARLREGIAERGRFIEEQTATIESLRQQLAEAREALEWVAQDPCSNKPYRKPDEDCGFCSPCRARAALRALGGPT